MFKQTSGRNRRILIVDDNPAIHDDLNKILARTDDTAALAATEAVLFGEAVPSTPTPRYELESAYQGREGLEKVIAACSSGRPFAMAFVDMRMPPGWDGVETVSRLWQADPDLQVVICTAYSDYSWSDIIDRLGNSDNLLILKKPFDNAEACQLASALTEKRYLEEQARIKMDQLSALVDERTAELTREMDERKTLEAQLLQSQKLEAVGQLAAGIAHEINTPTQFIGDNIRFLQDAVTDLQPLLSACHQLASGQGDLLERAQEVCETATEADLEFLLEEMPTSIAQSLDGIRRIADIVRAMKAFSHPGTDQKTPIDLNHAIRSTLTVAKNEWKYVAQVETDFAEDLPLVCCHPGEINQVILNLVVNAAHAIGDFLPADSQQMGTIFITTRSTDEFAEICIRDTGGGIPEEIRDKIFNPFFTTKEVGKGTGQGLAIARNVVVNNHGGELLVESQEGVGSAFTIRLPMAVPPEAAPPEEDECVDEDQYSLCG